MVVVAEGLQMVEELGVDGQFNVREERELTAQTFS